MNGSDNPRESLTMYAGVHAKSLMIMPKGDFFLDYVPMHVCENLLGAGWVPPAGLLLLRLRLRSMARPLAAGYGQNLWRPRITPTHFFFGILLIWAVLLGSMEIQFLMFLGSSLRNSGSTALSIIVDTFLDYGHPS